MPPTQYYAWCIQPIRYQVPGTSYATYAILCLVYTAYQVPGTWYKLCHLRNTMPGAYSLSGARYLVQERNLLSTAAWRLCPRRQGFRSLRPHSDLQPF